MTQTVGIEIEDGIAIVVTDNPPVNALSADVRNGLFKAIETVEADANVEAVVIHCAGRTFFAGADIREFDKPPVSPVLSEVIDRIEACTKPVVAAMHGTALGGGFEVALGCHFRVALASAKMGLPEVKLGLLPGAGGTQRLPRLIGPQKALDMIVSGDPVGAGKALDLGIVDNTVDGDIRSAAVAFAKKAVAEGLPIRRLSMFDERLAAARADMAPFEEHAAALLTRKRGLDAPRICADSVRNAITLPFAEGSRKEREFFMHLKNGVQSAAQRHLFFAERTAQRVDDMPKDVRPGKVEQVAVIGAGTMGGGIAMVFANAGIAVTLIDVQAEALKRGLANIEKNYARTAARSGKGDDWIAERVGRITGAESLEAVAQADLIIEAVFEDMALKHKIFADLDRLAKPGAILATNTSTLDVDEIAAATKRPEWVVGMHFFSPANVMRLVEVVRGRKTGFQALATAIGISRAVGKAPVTVGVCFGFVGNRMLYARTRQVERLLLEGAAPQAIDKAMTDFGFAMGPLAVSDLAGIDVGWRARQQAGSKIAPIADALAEMGRYGQKTGKGFHLYPEGARRGEPDPEVDALIARMAGERGVKRREISSEEITERLIYAMVNEGARILEEGIAARASDIDIIWVFGYGWPVQHGGPMFHADQIGAGMIAARLAQMAESSGDETLAPAPLLARLAAEGGAFGKL
ncbi:MAG: enoyl-CoA hydratase/isomerase family protein [Nitratireductor sp.]|nr:enoyl-CoA hydratase/isomerase family protein [Nitratireductor sp.]